MVVRQIEYGSAEYREACALRNEELRRPLGLDLRDEDLEAESDQLHFGLFDGMGLVGCVVAVEGENGRFQVRQMVVASGQQRQGGGRQLLAAAEAELRSRGYRVAFLHARVEAVGFYKKLGYSPSGDEFIEVTIPHLPMEKQF